MKQLQVGDVFRLEEGAVVDTVIPERFRFANKQLSMLGTRAIISIGKVLKPAGNAKLDNIADGIVNISLREGGLKLDKDSVIQFLEKARYEQDEELPPEFDTSYLIGEYVVVEALEWSQWAWRVTASRLKNKKRDPEGAIVQFFQTEGFQNSILDIKPIRKMKEAK